MHKGDVWFVRFPLEEDNTQTLVRPVIVLNEYILGVVSIKITKHAPRIYDSYDIPIVHWREANLRFESTARVSKVSILPEQNFLFKVGRLHPDDLTAIEKLYSKYLREGKNIKADQVIKGAHTKYIQLTRENVTPLLNELSGDVLIPNTVINEDNILSIIESIGFGAFYNRLDITSIMIPESVTFIDDNAFACCTNADILIPNSVVKVGENAFFNVKHITYYGDADGAPWGAQSMN